MTSQTRTTKGKVPLRVSLFCPKHNISLRRLKYQEPTKPSPTWIMTDWFWCTECNKPMQIKLEVTYPQ